MRAQQTDGLSHVSRGLDIGYGVALAATLLLGVPAAFTSEFRGPAAFSLVLALVTIPLWLGRRRAAARRTAGDSNVKVWRWSVALATTAMMASLLPGAGPGALLLSLMGALVLGVDIGFWAGAIAGVGYAILLGLEIAVVYGGGAVDIIPQSGGILVMLLLVAAVGHLIRNVETARSELARANVRLRRALLVEGELVLAQERARSARELHDGLGHSLTLVGMALQLGQRLRDRDAERAWEEIDAAARTNAEALETMRRWVRALDPPGAADTLGGRDTFEAIAESFRGTGLDVHVRHRGEQEPLPADASLFATRFLQEGLTNVLRHAEAGVVEIDVQQSPQQLRLAIGDDGRGNGASGEGAPGEGTSGEGASGEGTSGGGASCEGFGLRSLRERAELLGGTVGAGRSALGGFELTAILPLEPAEKGA